MPRNFWASSMLAVAWVGTAVAQEPTTDEIARELSNPTSALMSLNSQIDYRSFKGTLPGASDQSAWNYLFQPVFPFPQGSGANILFRPAIPVLFNQPTKSKILGGQYFVALSLGGGWQLASSPSCLARRCGTLCRRPMPSGRSGRCGLASPRS